MGGLSKNAFNGKEKHAKFKVWALVFSAVYIKYVTRYQDSGISLVSNDFGLLIVKVSEYIPFCCLLLAQSEQ